MTVKIYLRSIEHLEKEDKKKRLAMFDSNGNGDIDNLITDVPAGAVIIWKLDRCSGIKSITKIYSKKGLRNIFKEDPRKQLLCKGFKLRLSKDVKAGDKEAYNIEYVLSDDTKVIIDPYIRIPPPPTGRT
jgi:hypothetical protein